MNDAAGPRTARCSFDMPYDIGEIQHTRVRCVLVEGHSGRHSLGGYREPEQEARRDSQPDVCHYPDCPFSEGHDGRHGPFTEGHNHRYTGGFFGDCPGCTVKVTRNQDAAVLAYRAELEMVLKKIRNSRTAPNLIDSIYGGVQAVLSDHSAAADDIRERVERDDLLRAAVGRLRTKMRSHQGPRLWMLDEWDRDLTHIFNVLNPESNAADRALLATQQPAEGGDRTHVHKPEYPSACTGCEHLGWADTKQGDK